MNQSTKLLQNLSKEIAILEKLPCLKGNKNYFAF